MMTLSFRTTAVFAAALSILACSDDDGGDSGAGTTGDGGTGTTAASSTGGVTTDEPEGGSSTGSPPETTTGDQTGGSGSGGSTGAGTTGGGQTCTEDIPPNIGDMAGMPCCTVEESCTGAPVESGETPQDSDLGDLLECVGGVWTVTEGNCPQDCVDDHGEDAYYSGCFWRTSAGEPVYPQCGCKR